MDGAVNESRIYARISQPVKDELFALYERYGTWARVSREHNVPETTVRSYTVQGSYISLRIARALLSSELIENSVWKSTSELSRQGELFIPQSIMLKRYKNGGKLCTGPLHPPEGKILPLESFYVHRGTYRTGKLFTRCKDCVLFPRVQTHVDNHGFISISKIAFVFIELEQRLSHTEICRRAGFSKTIWTRLQYQHNIRKNTAYRAIVLLRQARKEGAMRNGSNRKQASFARYWNSLHQERLAQNKTIGWT